MRLVRDTPVLIDHLRGKPRAATELIPKALARGDELWSSHVARAELLAGIRAAEETATRDLLGLISWMEVDQAGAEASTCTSRHAATEGVRECPR